MTQITGAISKITDSIATYKTNAETFVTGVGGEEQRLKSLIEQLKTCLERLRGLKITYQELINNINGLNDKIDNLKKETQRTISKDADRQCNVKLENILTLIHNFGETIGNFDKNAASLKEQVDDLEKTITGVCEEADVLLEQQGNATKSVANLATRLGGEQKQQQAPAPQAPAPPAPPAPQAPPQAPAQTPQALQAQALQTLQAQELRAQELRAQTPSSSVAERTRIRRRNNYTSQGGGWQTPEKLESLSKTNPIRTYSSIKKTKGRKKKKSRRTRRSKKSKRTKRTKKSKKGGRKRSRRR